MSFKVGDIVEVVSVIRPENQNKIGLETRVLAVGVRFIAPEFGIDRSDGVLTSLNDPGKLFLPYQLRLKRPPSYPDQFTAGDWDLIPWQPQRERA
jgi:hypothetical protein